MESNSGSRAAARNKRKRTWSDEEGRERRREKRLEEESRGENQRKEQGNGNSAVQSRAVARNGGEKGKGGKKTQRDRGRRE